MKNHPEYKMAFGRRGRTVDYEDALGKFTFVFDVDYSATRTKGQKEKLLVSKVALKDMKVWQCQTEADREHLALMLERVKEYLISLGYDVDFE